MIFRNKKSLLVSFLLILLLVLAFSINCIAEENTSGTQNTYDVSTSHVVINQIYGAQAKGVYVSNSFIELYNQTDSAVDLSTWSVQYKSSAAGNDSEAWVKCDLEGTIPAHCSYLIKCAPGTEVAEGAYTIEAYDLYWEQELYTKGVAVVLMSNQTLLEADAVPFDNETNSPVVEGYVDMLAVAGNDGKAKQVPSAYEKECSAEQSKKKAIRRIGTKDTDNNSVEGDCEIVDYSSSNAAYIASKAPKYVACGPWTEEEKSGEIHFSHTSGMYEEAFALTMYADEGTIYYTLDGSVPNEDSYVYSESLTIADAINQPNRLSMREDISAGFLYNGNGGTVAGYRAPQYAIEKCTVLQAAVRYEDGTWGKVYSKTFYVDEENRGFLTDICVLSITTDAENLFDGTSGIYVLGDTYGEYDEELPWWWQNGNFRNKGSEWERESTFTFFDCEGKEVLTQNGGIRIHGGGSRGFAQKSFNLYARKKYDGNDTFGYDFFETGYFAKKLTLSQGGDDYKAKISDYLINSLCKGKASITIANMIPYVLFIDGEYWGVYYLQEKVDDHYFAYHYEVNPDEVVMIKNGEIEEGNEEDIELYNELKDYFRSHNMAIPANYEKACELIDIDSFIDYYAIEAYIGRYNDWPGSNYALWKTKNSDGEGYSDGKWRWVLFDLNSGAMNDYAASIDEIEYILTKDFFAKRLFTNAECYQKFVNRVIELGNGILNSEKISQFLQDYSSSMMDKLASSNRRYYGSEQRTVITAMINTIDTFFETRAEQITAQCESHFPVERWVKDDGKWYYVKADGTLTTGWIKDGEKWYYLKSDGSMASGWIKDGDKWYYLKPNGSMATGWVKDGDKWYYLKPNGSMATGWIKDGEKWYYLKPNGSMASGWIKDGEKWYYLKPNGSMATGWVKDGEKWYYLKSNGSMASGWLKDNDKWYYLKASGSMTTGWLKDGNKWYYLKANGSMATGWLSINGEKYHFSNQGAMD